MALYAIGDFHLSFAVNKPQDIFGEEWKDHANKIKKNWLNIVDEDDTVVVTGDHSWGIRMDEVRPDLEFIEALPGRKILLRGNHDKFWDSKKTERLNHEYQGRLYFLQNNFYTFGDYALVGTKGFSLDDEGRETPEQAEKLRNREAERLRKSFEKAKAAGYDKFIMFIHYPPTAMGEDESVFTRMAEEYGVAKVVYSHLHGHRKYGNSLRGMKNGVEYILVSSDYLDFKPEMIMAAEQPAYDQSFLNDNVKMTKDLFHIFITSGYDFNGCLVKYLLSEIRHRMDVGDESVLREDSRSIFESMDFSNIESNNNDDMDGIMSDFLAEAYTYTQWKYNILSRNLVNMIPPDIMEEMYNPLHEAGRNTFCRKIYEKYKYYKAGGHDLYK